MTKAKREREEMEAKRLGEDAIKAAREARAARKFALGKGTAKDPEAKSDGASTWSWWQGLVVVLGRCIISQFVYPVR